MKISGEIFGPSLSQLFPRSFVLIPRFGSVLDEILSQEHKIDGKIVDVKRAVPKSEAPGPSSRYAADHRLLGGWRGGWGAGAGAGASFHTLFLNRLYGTRLSIPVSASMAKYNEGSAFLFFWLSRCGPSARHSNSSLNIKKHKIQTIIL